jgi:hypothetical protein
MHEKFITQIFFYFFEQVELKYDIGSRCDKILGLHTRSKFCNFIQTCVNCDFRTIRKISYLGAFYHAPTHSIFFVIFFPEAWYTIFQEREVIQLMMVLSSLEPRLHESCMHQWIEGCTLFLPLHILLCHGMDET